MSHQQTFSRLLLMMQVSFLAFLVSSTTYHEESFHFSEYIIFRDIMAMLLIGFGYLMTFLASYGLGAVGFTMLLTAVSMQLNVVVEYAMKAAYYKEEQVWPLEVDMMTLIDAEFAAATVLITFGAMIGRATPLQMLITTVIQSIFYAFNKAVMVFGVIEAEDVGGTITIHMFGAYFGLAASYALGPPNADEDAEQDKISDIFAFIGTGILWVFWPSFVGATETANDEYEMRCVSNTAFALLASTTTAFYISHLLTSHKFDPVHIANSTLAGGVAIGSSARLVTAPGGAIVLGAIAGAASVLGYFYCSPVLESHLALFDTCGVGNLHGIPSLIGSVASVVFIKMNSDAEFLEHSSGSQIGRQFAAIACTMGISILSGLLAGKLMTFMKEQTISSFEDKCWWTAEYLETSRHVRALLSRHRAVSLQGSHHAASVLGSHHATKILSSHHSTIKLHDATNRTQQTSETA